MRPTAGAVESTSTSAPPVIENNVIENNRVRWKGGGIFCDAGSHPLIRNNVIRDNHTDDGFGSSGAGICCWDGSNPVIENNEIRNNSTGPYYGSSGGGIRVANSAPVIRNNLIADNWAHRGGGIYVNHHALVISGCTLARNEAGLQGGGISGSGDCDLTVENSILFDNISTDGPGIWFSADSAPALLTLHHSLLDGGAASIHLDGLADIDWGQGMLDGDPKFADPDGGDYHLTYESPCIDAGLDLIENDASTDVDGDPRQTLSGLDLGADEFHLHFYGMGGGCSGTTLNLKWAAQPGIRTVTLFAGTELRETPLASPFGSWHLGGRVMALLVPGGIPATGIKTLSARIPPECPPLSLPLQSLVDDTLTNPWILEVR